MKIVLLALLCTPLFGAVGCLDRKHHMQHERYYASVDSSLRSGMNTYRNEEASLPVNTGAWHPVACTCPCNYYQAGYLTRTNGAYGFCVKCRHRGPVGRRNSVEVPTDHIKLKKAFMRRNQRELPAQFQFQS